MSKLYKLLFVLLAITIAYGCQEDGKSTVDIDNIDTLATVIDDGEDEVFDIPENTTFKLPSPVELYLFLWEEDVNFNKESLNDLGNTTKYFTSASKAINFGVYASDLAYCTVFGKNQETFEYFTTVKTLADDMGLTEGFDESVAKRINENINNPDSLFDITASSYEGATSFLENQEGGNMLPFILSGAWVESVHIASTSVEKFSENNEIIIRIAEQQFLLENLMDYFKSVKKTEDMKALYEKLKDLQASYDKLYENTDVIITEEQYNEIVTKIKQIREGFIS